MFKDMRHTSGIWWVGLEADAEDIVLVVSCDVQVVGTGLVVLEEERRQLELRHMLRLLQSESMNAITRLWERI